MISPFSFFSSWLVFGLFVTVALSTQVGRIFNLWLVSCCINKARTNKVTGQFKVIFALTTVCDAIVGTKRSNCFCLELKISPRLPESRRRPWRGNIDDNDTVRADDDLAAGIDDLSLPLKS